MKTHPSRRPRRVSRRILAATIGFTSFIAACGGDGDAGSEPDRGASQPAPTNGGGQGSDAPGATSGGQDGTADGAPKRGGVLRVVHTSTPSRLDPHTATSGFDHYVLYPMFDRLVHFDANMSPIPGLAESWESPDDRTLILHLREGVTFHDGTPLNAEAVIYNLNRGLTLPDSAVAVDIESIESMEAIDDLTVKLNLNRPDSALVLNLSDKAGMMVSPTAAERLGDDFQSAPVGAGPFKFVEYVPGESLKLEAYEDYYLEGLPYLDGMEFTILSDSRTAVNALLSGQADFDTTVDVPDIDRIESASGYQLVSTETLALNRCFLRLGEGPFSILEVRKALNFGVDRDALNMVINRGLGEPIYAPLPTSHWAYPTDQTPVYRYDPEHAKELLESAGYPDGIDIDLIVVNSERDKAMVEAMQAQLEPAGIRLEVTVLDIAEASPAFRENGEGDMYCVGWSGRPDPHPSFQGIYDPDSVYVTDYEPPEGLIEALEATIAVSDIEERAAAFKEVHRIATVENALDFLVAARPGLQAHSDAVKGYVPNTYGKPIMNEVWLDQ